jgi:hypothetical protein
VWDEQEMLISLLDVRDLLALRLVSRKTRAWVDAVMPSHPTKAFTLRVDKEKTLDKIMGEGLDGIPCCRRLNIRSSSFFSHPLFPSFLRTFGPQIHTVFQFGYRGRLVPEEVAFYQALPNLAQLVSTTRWLGKNVPEVAMPSLRRLELHALPSELKESGGTFNYDFLLNFPNLSHLSLPNVYGDEYIEFWTAIGSYFKKRNGLEEGCFRRTLIIQLTTYNTVPAKLNTTQREQLAILLQELAVADGRILFEYMNVKLLDEAVRLFHNQQGGQLLLSSFGKSIRSLIGSSNSLYEVELPNMLKLKVHWALEGTVRDGDYSRTVSWPKLEEVNLKVRNDYLGKLVFGSGVFRPSVKRLRCDLKLLSFCSNEAHLLLANFPNVTHLKLEVTPEEVGLFRSLMRVLPRSCSKIQFLQLAVFFPLGDEDFLGLDEEGGLTTPPLLQLPGKYIM